MYVYNVEGALARHTERGKVDWTAINLHFFNSERIRKAINHVLTGQATQLASCVLIVWST